MKKRVVLLLLAVIFVGGLIFVDSAPHGAAKSDHLDGASLPPAGNAGCGGAAGSVRKD